jgi:Mg-chelatase subunit ChlD
LVLAPQAGNELSVRLADPLALLLLVPLGAIAAALRRRAVKNGDRRRQAPRASRSGSPSLLERPWLWALLHGAAAVLLVVALADPQLLSGSHRPTVFAVDQSASIDAEMRAIERDWTARAGDDACVSPCRVVTFAGGTRATAPTGPVATASAPDAGATDLESGIDAAIGLAPRNGRVVVLSDGGQTEGDLLATTAQARRRNVVVDWVDLGDRYRRDAAITRIAVPAAVHVGDTVPLALNVRSTVAGFAVLGVSSDGTAPRTETIRLSVGDNPLLLLYSAARAGWHSFKASIHLKGDMTAANNSLSAVTDVFAAPRVLSVGAQDSDVPALLSHDHMRVTAALPGSLPTNAAAYSSDDAVVLDDVSATQLTSSQIAALSSAVTGGGLGLLVLGGPHSFSLGRYATSGLQQLLPVASLVPGNLQRRNVAIELVLDHSGSMIDDAGGVPKIDMVHVAGRQTATFITKHQDQLGIIDFDVIPHTLVPLQRLDTKADEQRVDKLVDGLQADGGTNIYRGLAEGFRLILKSNAKERHIILMTDGISEPENYGPLLAQIKAAHITVATVALGSDADRSLLAQIAAATGGHAYVTDDAKDLPRIFAKETQLSAKPVRVTGHLSVVVSSDSPVVRSLAGKHLPGLRGNVVAQLKTGAEADLLAGDTGSLTDPALAEWQLGEGRAVTWTPGLGAPWASAWLSETSLWNDAVRWTERGVAPSALTPQALGDSAGTLQIDLAGDGTAALGVTSISGTLTAGDGSATRVDFGAAGPGLYQTAVPALAAGVYRFALTTHGAVSESASGELAIPYPAEYSPVPVEVSPLAQLTAQTGGQVLSSGQEAKIAAGSDSLRWLFALLALVLFLAGVVARMLPEAAPGGSERRRASEPEAVASERR